MNIVKNAFTKTRKQQEHTLFYQQPITFVLHFFPFTKERVYKKIYIFLFSAQKKTFNFLYEFTINLTF